MKQDQTKLGVLFLLAILFIMTLNSGKKVFAESRSETAFQTRTPYIVYAIVTATPQPSEAVSEPALISGVKLTENEVFYKEWEVKNA